MVYTIVMNAVVHFIKNIIVGKFEYSKEELYNMDKEIKAKYCGFVAKFINNQKICMTTKLERKYGENFFNDAIKDGILKEIEKNNIGKRQFIFTEYARTILL